jgi:hypothetical protein
MRLETVSDERLTSGDAEVLFREARRRRRQRRLGAAGAILVAAAAAVGAYFASSPSSTPHPHQPVPVRVPGPGAAPPLAWSGAAPKHPYGLAVGVAGGLYVIDVGRDQVLRRSRSGRFRVVAGDGHRGFSGDGGRATKARLDLTIDSGVAVAPDGSVYISDTGNRRVREVRPNGTIVTVAGGGNKPLGTRPVAARAASFRAGDPSGLAFSSSGALFIGASGVYQLSHGRLRWVVGTPAAPPANWRGVDSNPAVQQDFDPAVRLAFDGRGDLLVAGGGGFGLYERTAAGHLQFVENFRGDGEWGSLATMPDGDVLLAARDGLSVFHRSGTITPLPVDLNAPLTAAKAPARHNTFIGGDGLAVGPDGTIYADTNSGNDFTSASALIALATNHRTPTALWKS